MSGVPRGKPGAVISQETEILPQFTRGPIDSTRYFLTVNATPVGLEEVAEHRFLRGLSEAHLDTLADCAMRLRFHAGDVIFREGDPANRFYLIIKGKVAIEAEFREKRLTVQHVMAGDVLGWSWLFPPYYFEFDARAVEPTEVMFFYGSRLREACEDDRDLGYELMKRSVKVVIDRLVCAEKKLVSAST